MYKLYVSKAADPTGPMYHVLDYGPTGTTEQITGADSTFVDNDLAPVPLTGIKGWAIYDAFGVGDPTTDPMPLFRFLLENVPPHRYQKLDCTPIVHSDGAGGFVIQVLHRGRNEGWLRVHGRLTRSSSPRTAAPSQARGWRMRARPSRSERSELHRGGRRRSQIRAARRLSTFQAAEEEAAGL